jgi:hypothetical protein
MPFASMVLIQSLIVGLSAALGAALALLRWRNLSTENTVERQASPRREIPFVWLGN